MPRRIRVTTALAFGLVLFLSAAFPFSSMGAEAKKKEAPNSLVSLDFYDVDINVFIKFISDLTGKNFIVDRQVKGTVNVISPSALTKEEAYRVFQSVLEVQGFTTIPAGDVIKIVPQQKAKDSGVQTLVEKERAPLKNGADVMVTRIIALKYADADELQTLLAPLISKSSVIAAHAPTNTLVITDVDSNIERLIRIIREIDVPGFSRKITVIKLKHAGAKELAQQLTELLQTEERRLPRTARAKLNTGTSPEVKIIPEERTNTLVVLAAVDDTNKIKDLVTKLDTPTPTGRDYIHVYYLSNGVAEDVAKVLGEVKTAEASQTDKNVKPSISKNVLIVPDKSTNSLVIRATPEEYKALAKVIDRLDIPRSMVYVEALIVEVSTQKAMKLGVEWVVGKTFGGNSSVVFGGNTAGTLGSVDSLSSAIQTQDSTLLFPPGFALGVLGEAISFGDVTFPSIQALINAVSTDSDFNILSTPQILTTDNVEAEVKVAQNLPFLTQANTGDQITSRTIQNFEYRDVGVVLKVTPQINQSRFVRLTIEEEVKNVVSAQTESGGQVLLAPTTNVRSAKTTVIVKDGETVVIGGLIENQNRGQEVRVPCLGELPIIGALFRTTSDQTNKTNLMVFMTPHILENTEEARELYDLKRAQLREIQKQQTQLQRGPTGEKKKPGGGENKKEK
jgi:general secretion pathway protein D